jgi:hypothetical protein
VLRCRCRSLRPPVPSAAAAVIIVAFCDVVHAVAEVRCLDLPAAKTYRLRHVLILTAE